METERDALHLVLSQVYPSVTPPFLTEDARRDLIRLFLYSYPEVDWHLKGIPGLCPPGLFESPHPKLLPNTFMGSPLLGWFTGRVSTDDGRVVNGKPTGVPFELPPSSVVVVGEYELNGRVVRVYVPTHSGECVLVQKGAISPINGGRVISSQWGVTSERWASPRHGARFEIPGNSRDLAYKTYYLDLFEAFYLAGDP